MLFVFSAGRTFNNLNQNWINIYIISDIIIQPNKIVIKLYPKFNHLRSKIALEESSCRGASIYNFEGTQLDDDAKRHCETAKRYYVGVNEQFSLDPSWRTQREVKNPEVGFVN